MLSRRSFVYGLGAFGLSASAHASEIVDLALVMAIDCSLSVDEQEFRLQLRGTGQAMIDSELVHLIENGANQTIAVSVFLWSGPNAQQIVVPWRLLRSGADAIAVADDILNARRNIDASSTAIGSALEFAENLIARAPRATRYVVDVSTNGKSNMGTPVKPVRDRLVKSGITINGLAVSDKDRTLVNYMVQHVTGGDGSFVITANGFNAYTHAIRLKLYREVTGLLSI